MARKELESVHHPQPSGKRQIKAPLRFRLILVKMATVENTDDHKGWLVGASGTLASLVGMSTSVVILEINLRIY